LTCLGKAREILRDIQLHISGMKVLNQGCINIDKLKLKELKHTNLKYSRLQAVNEYVPLSVKEIVSSANEIYLNRIEQMNYSPVTTLEPSSMLVSGEDYSADNLEFVKSIWKQKTKQKPTSLSDSDSPTDISSTVHTSKQQYSLSVLPLTFASLSQSAEQSLARELENELTQKAEYITRLHPVKCPSSSSSSSSSQETSPRLKESSSRVPSSQVVSWHESIVRKTPIELLPVLFQQKTLSHQQHERFQSDWLEQQQQQQQHQQSPSPSTSSLQAETVQASADDEKKREERRERRRQKKEEKRRRREQIQKEQEELQKRAQQMLEELNKQQQSRTQSLSQQSAHTESQTTDNTSTQCSSENSKRVAENKSVAHVTEITKKKAKNRSKQKESSDHTTTPQTEGVKKKQKDKKKRKHKDRTVTQSIQLEGPETERLISDNNQYEISAQGEHKKHENKSPKKRKYSELMDVTFENDSIKKSKESTIEPLPPLPSNSSEQSQQELSSHQQTDTPSNQQELFVADERSVFTKENLRKILSHLDSTVSTKQRKKALRALRNHAVIEENKNILRELGTIPVLIKIIQNMTVPAEEKELATATLAQLAFNKTNSELICSSGGIPTLLTLLNERSNLALLEAAVRALGILSHQDTNAREIISLNGVTALINLLEPPCNLEVQIEAINALTSLLSHDPNVSSLILSSKGIEKLTQMLSLTTSNALSAALKALIALVKCNEGAKTSLKSLWTVRKQVLALMHNGQPELKAFASELAALLYPDMSKEKCVRPFSRRHSQTASLSRSWAGRPQQIRTELCRSFTTIWPLSSPKDTMMTMKSHDSNHPPSLITSAEPKRI